MPFTSTTPGWGRFKFENQYTWPNFFEMYSRIKKISLYQNETKTSSLFLQKNHHMTVKMIQNACNE